MRIDVLLLDSMYAALESALLVPEVAFADKSMRYTMFATILSSNFVDRWHGIRALPHSASFCGLELEWVEHVADEEMLHCACKLDIMQHNTNLRPTFSFALLFNSFHDQVNHIRKMWLTLGDVRRTFTFSISHPSFCEAKSVSKPTAGETTVSEKVTL